jgi:hypothetical protein
MSPERLRWIPMALLVIFALFWSFWDMKLGLWTGLGGSGLVICYLLAMPDRSDEGGRR